LYTYKTFAPEVSEVFYLLIVQKHDDEYVYFYENFNFLCLERLTFSDEKAEKLKEINDWNKELNEEKFVKAVIKNTRPKSTFKSDSVKKKASELGLKSPSGAIFFQKDETGKQLFILWGNKPAKKHMLILNSDGTYDAETCLEEIQDMMNYQEQLAEFKAKNNWNPLR